MKVSSAGEMMALSCPPYLPTTPTQSFQETKGLRCFKLGAQEKEVLPHRLERNPQPPSLCELRTCGTSACGGLNEKWSW